MDRRCTPSPHGGGGGNQNVPPGNSGGGGGDASDWSPEDREALRLARWIDSLGVSLRRAGGTLAGGSPARTTPGSAGLGRDGGGFKSPQHQNVVAEFQKGKLKPAAELAVGVCTS